MKLHRPHIPLAIRVAVAERQAMASLPLACLPWGPPPESPRKRLAALLGALFGDQAVELHHRPALVNRRHRLVRGEVVYSPPANDPEHLVYLLKGDHEIETRVRGVGALRSDLGERRYRKRLARNRAPKKKARPWPKRLRSWPKRNVRA